MSDAFATVSSTATEVRHRLLLPTNHVTTNASDLPLWHSCVLHVFQCRCLHSLVHNQRWLLLLCIPCPLGADGAPGQHKDDKLDCAPCQSPRYASKGFPIPQATIPMSSELSCTALLQTSVQFRQTLSSAPCGRPGCSACDVAGVSGFCHIATRGSC